ncbi:energy transducer TonB [Bacteroides faecium]|uniref:TonB family protein n=1 Tax=Bacteroides faecium TaxID=2715212 RepID=A0A6H0KJ55_9BACE|nr:TonB family protein [Bacteroides faecium]QIU93400.1 TonB family protein [Bacteroides faecium]
MKKIAVLLWMIVLAISASAQQFSWPPQTYPSSVPYKVSEEVNYYWSIEQITCIGKGNGGYKFRIKGTAGHDFESNKTVDMFYIVSNNRLVTAGSYFFPKVSKGQKFSFEVVSAFSGYTPADFQGFFIHDKWLSIPKERTSQSSLGTTQNNAIIKLTPEQMTRWRGEGLYGNVKNVTDDKGTSLTFNSIGNIIRYQEGDYTTSYSYTSPRQYTDAGGGFKYEIVFTDSTRKEFDKSPCGPTDEFTFDSQCRVIKHSYFECHGDTKKYFYRDSEKLPFKMTAEARFETGEDFATYIFQYLNVDTHGNWTKRKVTKTIKSVEYSDNGKNKVINSAPETSFETRIITYYPEAATASTAVATRTSQSPSFVGGQAAMKKFFADNAHPRKPAIATAGYGEVIVEFTVNESGEVSSAKLKGRVSVSMDEEALRLVNMMPKWNPGLTDGQPAKMKVQVGLRFFPNQAFRYIKAMLD